MAETLPNDKDRSVFEKQMIQKLAYEWKNIYRTLQGIDSENSGYVTLFDFETGCEKSKVTITQNDIIRLYKMFSDLD